MGISWGYLAHHFIYFSVGFLQECYLDKKDYHKWVLIVFPFSKYMKSQIFRIYTFLQKCHFCVENSLAWMYIQSFHLTLFPHWMIADSMSHIMWLRSQTRAALIVRKIQHNWNSAEMSCWRWGQNSENREILPPRLESPAAHSRKHTSNNMSTVCYRNFITAWVHVRLLEVMRYYLDEKKPTSGIQ